MDDRGKVSSTPSSGSHLRHGVACKNWETYLTSSIKLVFRASNDRPNFASYGTTSRLSNSLRDDWTIMVLVRGGLANSKLAGAEAHSARAGESASGAREGGRELANKCDREKQTRK